MAALLILDVYKRQGPGGGQRPGGLHAGEECKKACRRPARYGDLLHLPHRERNAGGIPGKKAADVVKNFVKKQAVFGEDSLLF